VGSPQNALANTLPSDVTRTSSDSRAEGSAQAVVRGSPAR